ncbi:hypothetical protein [Sulfidibacter corallicola]|uniref:Uncharacterized protein n=1 Tax=Sulfidibacter corallicola TaxID=2818388 RepID=A0A8A4U2R9_SULCO|nr:hypothetical protein [Sulfidibacter corallicola]QTD53025.1 hypothetical protein J3U87_11230 [Sulfidibacter corallicola]
MLISNAERRRSPRSTIPPRAEASRVRRLKELAVSFSSIDDDHLFFDLQTMAVDARHPERCWLLVKRRETLADLPWREVFLLSVPKPDAGDDRTATGESSPDAARLIRSGEATPLEEARRYFEDLAGGRIAADLPPFALAHLGDDEPDLATRFSAEREYFAERFTHEAPRLGLQGFLTKCAQRFPLAEETAAEIQKVLSWLKP